MGYKCGHDSNIYLDRVLYKDFVKRPPSSILIIFSITIKISLWLYSLVMTLLKKTLRKMILTLLRTDWNWEADSCCQCWWRGWGGSHCAPTAAGAHLLKTGAYCTAPATVVMHQHLKSSDTMWRKMAFLWMGIFGKLFIKWFDAYLQMTLSY